MAFRTAGGADYSSSLSHRYDEDCDFHERDDRRHLTSYHGADDAVDPRAGGAGATTTFPLGPDPFCVSPFNGSPEPVEPAWAIARPQPLPAYFILREDSPSPPPALARSISQPPLPRQRYPELGAVRSWTPNPARQHHHHHQIHHHHLPHPPHNHHPSRTATSTPLDAVAAGAAAAGAAAASAWPHGRPIVNDDPPFQGAPFLRIKEHPPSFPDNEVDPKNGFPGVVPSGGGGSGGRSPELDLSEANLVRDNLDSFQWRSPDSKHERILLSIIHPNWAGADFALDEKALLSIFWALNEMFFGGLLTNRVEWKWSDETSNPDYANRIAGYTSLRHVSGGGYEPSITLSTPILRDPKYNRRLLISAFIHELIHCYLFVRLGFAAFDKGCNGHTEDFKEIARIIDDWAGDRNNLYLCEMEADLDNFRQAQGRPPRHEIREHDHHNNNNEDSGFEDEDATYRHDFCCPAVISAPSWAEQCDRWDKPVELARSNDCRDGPPYVY